MIDLYTEYVLDMPQKYFKGSFMALEFMPNQRKTNI